MAPAKAKKRKPSPSELRTKQVRALMDVLAARARPGERAEELLIDFGLVSDRELASAIAERTGLVYTGLRGVVPDADLFVYVTVGEAMAQRICPLELDGDVLRIASAFVDPDLSGVKERFPGLELELQISPRDEILAAVSRVGA